MRLRAPRHTLVVLACIALAVGLLEPYLEIAWKCRAGFEASEACVWGKSLMPLGRIAGLDIVAPVTFVALLVIRWAWHARAGMSPPSD
jgi:hypothetical protein